MNPIFKMLINNNIKTENNDSSGGRECRGERVEAVIVLYPHKRLLVFQLKMRKNVGGS